MVGRVRAAIIVEEKREGGKVERGSRVSKKAGLELVEATRERSQAKKKKKSTSTSASRLPAFPSLPLLVFFLQFPLSLSSRPASSSPPPVEPARPLPKLHPEGGRRRGGRGGDEGQPAAQARPRGDHRREDGSEPRAADAGLRVAAVGRGIGYAVLPADRGVGVLLLRRIESGGKEEGGGEQVSASGFFLFFSVVVEARKRRKTFERRTVVLAPAPTATRSGSTLSSAAYARANAASASALAAAESRALAIIRLVSSASPMGTEVRASSSASFSSRSRSSSSARSRCSSVLSSPTTWTWWWWWWW